MFETPRPVLRRRLLCRNPKSVTSEKERTRKALDDLMSGFTDDLLDALESCESYKRNVDIEALRKALK